VAAAGRVYLQGAPPGRQSGRQLQNVVHELHHRPEHAFGGTCVALVPHERIRYTDKFDDPNLSGEMNVTVSFRGGSVGMELSIVQEGVPDVVPPEACYLGWQQSLTLLARLVEAEIPD
jgi:uncharacterized protein YndB with AHSA1/START domain